MDSVLHGYTARLPASLHDLTNLVRGEVVQAVLLHMLVIFGV